MQWGERGWESLDKLCYMAPGRGWDWMGFMLPSIPNQSGIQSCLCPGAFRVFILVRQSSVNSLLLWPNHFGRTTTFLAAVNVLWDFWDPCREMRSAPGHGCGGTWSRNPLRRQLWAVLNKARALKRCLGVVQLQEGVTCWKPLFLTLLTRVEGFLGVVPDLCKQHIPNRRTFLLTLETF